MTIIAVDGVAASGKGTLSEALAKRFGFGYLDTGKLYRSVALYVIDNKVEIDEKIIAQHIPNINFSHQFEKELGTDDVSQMASIIAAFPEVRRALDEYQKNFPKSYNGSVIDGRDIGTVIFPNADVKLFITASVEERAQRRYKQLQSKGISVSYSDVLMDLKARDKRDTSRKASPAHPADDAVIIDTTNLDIDEVLDLCCKLCADSIA